MVSANRGQDGGRESQRAESAVAAGETVRGNSYRIRRPSGGRGNIICFIQITAQVIMVIASLAGIGAWPVTSHAESAKVVRVRDDAVTVIGPLDWDTANTLRSLLDERVKIIGISSPGGDWKAAMAIGRIIRSRNVTLYVTNYCLGACSQYVFPAAAMRSVEKDTLITFGSTAVGANAIVSNDKDADVRDFFSEQSGA